MHVLTPIFDLMFLMLNLHLTFCSQQHKESVEFICDGLFLTFLSKIKKQQPRSTVGFGALLKTLILPRCIHSWTSFDLFFGSVFCCNSQLCSSFNHLTWTVDPSYNRSRDADWPQCQEVCWQESKCDFQVEVYWLWQQNAFGGADESRWK